jgi:hypothetical protein
MTLANGEPAGARRGVFVASLIASEDL